MDVRIWSVERETGEPRQRVLMHYAECVEEYELFEFNSQMNIASYRIRRYALKT